MKEGRPLPELATELQRQADAKRDYIAPSERLSVSSNGRTEMILGDPFPVTDIAHGQIADYLDIPKAYYDRLREKSEELTVRDPNDYVPERTLFDVTVNSLLASKGPQRRLVRTLDGQVRAFLSDSFSVDLDNVDVYRVAARVIEEAGLGPENVLSAEVTEKRLYMKVVSPRIEAVIRPSNVSGSGLLREPQVVQAGFILSNSETGLGSLRVSQLVFKLLCSNGWIREESLRQRHIGKALETGENGSVYRSDTRAQDAKLRLMKVRDHISSALDPGAFRDFVDRMQETTSIRLEAGAEKCVDAVGRKFGLSQGEKERVLGELIQGADMTLWGMTNAVTAAAQKCQSYDRSTELEGIGGKFFSLTRPEIREIVAAR
jgi:hypothetical protein